MMTRWLTPFLTFFLSLSLVAPITSTAGEMDSATPSSIMGQDLTLSLIDIQDQHQAAPAAHKAKHLEKMLAKAEKRQQHLAMMIEKDPGQVLRLRVPKRIRNNMPPAVQPLVEDEVTAEGEMEVLHEDRPDGSRYHHFLRTSNERLVLHFAGEAPTLKTGHRVRIKGVRVKHAVAMAGGSGGLQTLAAPLSNTFGVQSTLVILVNFQDNAAQPFTTDYARTVVFTSTNDWDRENSFQQTWLTGDVHGWFTIPMSSTVCDYNTLASQAKAAASAAGVNLANYKRYVYGFPRNACGWSGLGTVGGFPSQSWINGSFNLRVVGHEMGHNLGLWHSKALECGATTIGTSCTSIEYGDTLDIMGSSSGHINAFQKERLGWLNSGSSPPITTVLTSGTYMIDAYEPAGSSAKALKVLRSTESTGKRNWYYIEYRRPIGFDSFVNGNSNVMNGVVIHQGSEVSSDSSFLLDMTPGTSSWNDPALTIGQSFVDPAAGVTIDVAWVNSTTAAVNVSMGSSPPCVRANPTMTVTPSESQWVPAGTAVTYTLSVTNRDNGGCTAGTFDLHATAPTGWAATFATTPLTAAPGATASATVTVTSPASLGDGFYTIGLSATNRAASTFTASSSVTYVVQNLAVVAPTITAQPANMSVVAPGTVTFYIIATGTAPLSYQWQKNGINILGATGASYTTPATSITDSGTSYRVVVSNSAGSVTSSTVTLSVGVGPTITSQPANITVTAPAAATFSVTATGSAPLNYQWQKNGVNIPGATSTSYTKSPTSTASSGIYRVVVSNIVSSVTSSEATLTVNGGAVALTFTYNGMLRDKVGQNNRATSADGALDGTFTLTLAGGGTRTLTGLELRNSPGGVWDTQAATPYWTLGVANGLDSALLNPADSVSTAMANGGSVTLFAADLNNSMFKPGVSVTVTATFADGTSATASTTLSGTSNPATVTLAYNGKLRDKVGQNNMAAIADGALDGTFTLTRGAGGGALTVVALDLRRTDGGIWDTLPTSPYWTLGVAGNIDGALLNPADMLNIPLAAGGSVILFGADYGSSLFATGSVFTLTVTFTDGTSATATTTVSGASSPTITSQPVSKTVTAPATATFSVTASGSAPLTYQWRKNGLTIAGATGASYTTPATSTADSGSGYHVEVSNSVNSVSSSTATLTVNGGAPTITSQPVSKTVTAPATATFSVTATGTAPLSYQWRKNGLTIAGATGASYTTPATSTADSGSGYHVEVSNSAGIASSNAATLTVTSGGAAALTFTYNGTLRDKVGRGNGATSADGALDGTFTLTLASGGPRTLTGLEFRNSPGGVWDTQAATVYWTLGVANSLDSALLNPADNVSTSLANGGSVILFAADSNNSMFKSGVSFTVTATFADGTSATAATTVGGTSSPATVTLAYNGKLRDKVGQNNTAASADGALDGTFTLTRGAGGGAQTVTAMELRRMGGGVWDTLPTSPYWTLGVASSIDGALLNPADTLNIPLAAGGSVILFGADYGSSLFATGSVFTLTVTFTDGTSATATATVGISPLTRSRR
jgi:hypothetical protein